MLVARYPNKKALKEAKGEPLAYQETSMFGNEYHGDGVYPMVGPGAYERKFYASVTIKDGLIAKVE